MSTLGALTNKATGDCDPFVRIMLLKPGSVAISEAETRVVHRNRHVRPNPS